MHITVIICTYNRAEGLILLLKSLLQQTLDVRKWDVLIVNNNSKDDTLERFCQFQRECLSGNNAMNVRIVTESQQGLSYARNRGVAEAKGDFLIFVDDDEEASPNFMQTYYDNCYNKGASCIAGGPMLPVYETEKPKWVSIYVERNIASYIEFKGSRRFFPKGSFPIGGNMGISADIFKEYGGFSTDLGRTGDSLLGGEECDLFRRVASNRSDILYLHDAKIFHHIPASRTTIDFLRQMSRMVGISERLRTSKDSSMYVGRVVSELFKWAATLILAVGYTMCFAPSKASALILMRKEITRGLLGLK